MSKVYSFRLDKNNPREAQAREVIDAWMEKGYSLRNILTDALISPHNKHKGEADMLVEQLKSLLENRTNTNLQRKNENDNDCKVSLPSSFVDAVKVSVKNGVRSIKNEIN